MNRNAARHAAKKRAASVHSHLREVEAADPLSSRSRDPSTTPHVVTTPHGAKDDTSMGTLQIHALCAGRPVPAAHSSLEHRSGHAVRAVLAALMGQSPPVGTQCCAKLACVLSEAQQEVQPAAPVCINTMHWIMGSDRASEGNVRASEGKPSYADWRCHPN